METVKTDLLPSSKPEEGLTPHHDLPLLVIERRPGWKFLDLAELWRYRELLFFLAWRDIKVRYKQTALGVFWAILQPFAIMVVFSLFFHRLADLPSGGVPYPLFAYAGLLPWIFFANAITAAGQSVVGSQNLVTKVYFPRIIIPMSAVAAALVDFAIAFGMLLGLMGFYMAFYGWSWAPGWGILLLPLLTMGLALTAVGVGTLLAALTVAYRDFRHVVPFLVQLWMFATPTIYLSEGVLREYNPRWAQWLPLNPVDGLIANFRAAALGLNFTDVYALTVSSGVGLAFLVIGCLYFRRVERTFADII